MTILQSLQRTFQYSKPSYVLNFETLYKGQAVTTDSLEYHYKFHSDPIHIPKFTDKM